MTAEDWEAWCDATADLGDEPPPGSGWDDEEEDADPELAAGEQLAWAASPKAGWPTGCRAAAN